MAILHVLIGRPGSGKSTYAMNIMKEYKAILISTDRMRSAKLPKGFSEKEIWEEVYRLTAFYLNKNIDVIFDTTAAFIKVRKRLKDYMDNVYHVDKYEMYAYYFDTPFDVCYERIAKRNENKNERYFPLEALEIYRNVEEPTLEEGFIKIFKF